MKTVNHKVQLTCLIALFFLFFMGSCEKEMIGPQESNKPVHNFDYFWKSFDEHYGLFDVKQIDWAAKYAQYRPQVNDQMTDAQFYEVITRMATELNDNHLNIYPTSGNLGVFPGGVLRYKNGKLTILKIQEDYDWEISKKYLIESHELSGELKYGKTPDNIGYITISGHSESLSGVDKKMEEIISALRETKGIIVDVRSDYGGDDANAQRIAGHFASTQKLYMTSRKRNGPKHSDFTETASWFVHPSGDAFTKPVILLTSRFTQSAGESFTLAMKEFSHVRVVGDTTAGSFSDNPSFELPNGWIFSISVGDYRAADGTSYEGTGLSPDIFRRTTRSDLLGGKDKALEEALFLLNH